MANTTNPRRNAEGYPERTIFLKKAQKKWAKARF